MSGDIQVPIPVNERVLPYTAGSPEKKELKAKLGAMASEEIDVARSVAAVTERHRSHSGMDSGGRPAQLTRVTLTGIHKEIAWFRNVSLQRVRHLHWFC